MRKKVVGISVCMLMIAAAFVGAAGTVVADDWPMQYHDATNDRASTSPALETAGIKWDKNIGSSFRSVVADGKVFVKTYEGMLYCFDALTGEEEWSNDTGISGYDSFMVHEGKIYWESYVGPTNYVNCFDASNGNLLWSRNNMGSDITAADGKLFTIYRKSQTTHWGYRLDCHDASTGDLIWNTTYLMGYHNWGDPLRPVTLYGPPAVYDGYVYVVGDYRDRYNDEWRDHGMVYCFDADPDDNGDGVVNESDDEGIDDPSSIEFDLVWMCDIPNEEIIKPPSIADLGYDPINDVNMTRVYVITESGKVHCFDANPDDNGDGFVNFPHVGDWGIVWPLDGNFYFDPSDPNRVYLGQDVDEGIDDHLTLSYDLIWIYDEIEGSEIPSSLAVANGKVYVTSEREITLVGTLGYIQCLNAIGNGGASPAYSTTTSVWSKTSEMDHPYSNPILVSGELYTTIKDEGLTYFDALNGAEVFSTGLDISVQCVGDNGFVYGQMGSKLVCIGENNAPSTPYMPDKPTEGNVGETLLFSAVSNDVDGDNIHYFFDWGDGNDTYWLPDEDGAPSGEQVSASHAWDTPGDYLVRVKARDGIGASESDRESDWTEVEVHISKLRVDIMGGLGASAMITNEGDVSELDVEWSIDVDGDMVPLLGDGSYSGTISLLKTDTPWVLSTGPFLGIGKCTITVTAESDTEYMTETTDAFVLLFYVMLGEFGINWNAPDTPDAPDGPTVGMVDQQLLFSAITTDADGDDVFYWFDWGDGNDTGWIGPYPSGAGPIFASHAWEEPDYYQLKVKAMDTYGKESGFSEELLISITGTLGVETTASGNPPVTPDAPDGPTEGNVGEQILFNALTTDPDDDDVFYWFDWGDGENSGWLGPYPSGSGPIYASYAWEDVDTYEVKVKAKDTNGQESDFSEPSTINISLPFEVGVTGIYGGFGGVTVDVTNIKDEALPPLIADITIDLAGGTLPGFHVNKHYTERAIIESGTTKAVKVPCFALGRFEITATVECAGKPLHTTTAMGYILFTYVIITS